ncbi:hypothetical protein NRI_0779 [Neorickettsia risticii str. Illinois]|uniref:Uncharacterized protein n=1 Tax=Neorickettsia risticii (strain Illinois) TaxID=434131 RepID=C6V5T3_NEORI|nr:hypothetical protein NRI_0779 [Neorickettsia risticii str. Illinois]
MHFFYGSVGSARTCYTAAVSIPLFACDTPIKGEQLFKRTKEVCTYPQCSN